jgi:hypothetical protein
MPNPILRRALAKLLIQHWNPATKTGFSEVRVQVQNVPHYSQTIAIMGVLGEGGRRFS